MGWTKNVKFVVLNPDDPESDLVFYASDWILVEPFLSILPRLEVEYRAHYSNSGRLKYVDIVAISDEKYKAHYENSEMYLALLEKARETEKLLAKAKEVLPEDISVVVDDLDNVVKVYVGNALAVRLVDKGRYILANIYKLPGEIYRKVEVLMYRKGFTKGEYGGLITKFKRK